MPGHPIPDEQGIEAVKMLLQLKHDYKIHRDDIMLCLISGGSSALLPYPIEGITLADKQFVTGLLLSCGADIYEINSIIIKVACILLGENC